VITPTYVEGQGRAVLLGPAGIAMLGEPGRYWEPVDWYEVDWDHWVELLFGE
jgi:hypothetical protein